MGYGGGWGTQLMRPAPGYLPDWQYGYAPGVPPAYAPYNSYYNGYAGPPPAHHQQVRTLVRVVEGCASSATLMAGLFGMT